MQKLNYINKEEIFCCKHYCEYFIHLQKSYTETEVKVYGKVFMRGCYSTISSSKMCEDGKTESIAGLIVKIECCKGDLCNRGEYTAPSVLLMLTTAALVAIFMN